MERTQMKSTQANIRHALFAAALVAAAPAFAGSPTTTGGLATPANRIVGVWANTAMVGPCNGTPGQALRQTIVFHAGGTFLDNSPFPPAGIPNVAGIPGTHQRSIGVGAWSYDPLTGRYTLDQRFDWFVDNQYHGYQVVHRTILVSSNGNAAAGPVRTTRYAANGAVVMEQCGSAASTRL